jgi:ribosomal protein L12E/L44/L45/RPP1/RPP2
MSDAKPFAFSQFVPGFDFLQSLAKGASGGASAVPGMPSLSSWVAPTLSVEEVDKRIQELKTVQYWLEQNGHALKATIQALEVQKMTLSTLRGMNLHMEDLANAFTRPVTPPPAPAAPAPQAQAPEPEPEAEPDDLEEPEEPAEVPAPKRGGKAKASNGPAAPDAAGGVIDPLQWWGALTQQFQQIASSALQDASQLKMPAVAQPIADAVGEAMSGAAARPVARKTGASPKKAPAAAKKTTPRKRTRAR